ncbi:MAG TPA: hypothetical protein VJ891_05935, partial [Casimicrobiaceae bacterium]|nr:hypothetical protein [Casimicrobiaceae bacterium]
AITDATGRVLLNPPTVTNQLGTNAPVLPLTITPPSATCTAGADNNFDFLVTGGTGTYNAIVAPSLATPPTVNSGTVHVTILTPEAVAQAVYTLSVSSGNAIATAKITCQ